MIIVYLGDLFYLHVVEFHRCSTTEDLYYHLEFLLLLVDLFYGTIEVVERSVNDLNGLTNDIWFCVAYTLFAHLVHLTEHLVHFSLTKGGRILFTEEMDNTRNVFLRYG